MGNQLALLEVQKTHPSRREQLNAFKERQGVYTHHAKHRPRAEHPWSALLVPRARKRLAGYLEAGDQNDPFSLIAGYCRLLEEWDLLVTGETERDAIERLCLANNMTPP